MRICIANSVGVSARGEHFIHFPSRWTALVGTEKGFTYYPYELAYLSSLLKRDTLHDVKLIDGNLLQLNAAAYSQRLLEYRPEVLIMEPSTVTFEDDLAVARTLQHTCGTKIIFVGPHASAFPAETVAEGIDYVCIGEYEYTVLDIVCGKPKEQILGLYPNARRPLLDINSLPFPEDTDISRWDYINIAGSDYKEIEMFASRGCPMSCVFCVCRHLYYGIPNWRPRSVASLIEEITYLRNKYPSMEGIFFDEEDHNAHKPFIMSLTAAIKEAGLDDLKYNAMCGYWSLDKEMMTAMRSAGYYKLRIGIETASEVVACAMKKKIDIPRLIKVLKIARGIGMKMYGTFTIGAPEATEKEDLKTVRLIRDLVRQGLLNDLQISICTPQPGTPFYQWAQARGYLQSTDWRDYDGATRSVVNYPKYSAETIQKVFRLAHEVYHSELASRQRRHQGLVSILGRSLSRNGIMQTFFRGIAFMRDELKRRFL